MGIKSSGSKPKIIKSESVIRNCPEMPSFSFKYLTTKKNFNFGKMVKGDKKEWQSALAERIIELSQNTWLYWFGLNKEQGIETIYSSQLNFPPNNYSFSEDEKVIVFRFNSQKGRIIGIKNNRSPIYYVIGLDTDYSAYDHGN